MTGELVLIDRKTINISDVIQTTLTLSSIRVTPPAKTIYNIGESLNTSGMVVTATYSDNSTRNVTSLSFVSGFRSSTSGTQNITVSFEDGGITKTASFTVTVNARQYGNATIICCPPHDSRHGGFYYLGFNPQMRGGSAGTVSCGERINIMRSEVDPSDGVLMHYVQTASGTEGWASSRYIKRD